VAKQKQHVRFSQLLTIHVNNVVQKKFVNEQLNDAMLRSLRDTIKGTINEVFRRSNHNLEEKSLVWLTDQFFKRVKVNDDQSVNDMVVIHEYKLSQLPYHDVELLRNLFNNTELSVELEEEYKQRSTS